MGIGVLIEGLIGIIAIIAFIILACWKIEFEIWYWPNLFKSIAHHIKRITRKKKTK